MTIWQWHQYHLSHTALHLCAVCDAPKNTNRIHQSWVLNYVSHISHEEIIITNNLNNIYICDKVLFTNEKFLFVLPVDFWNNCHPYQKKNQVSPALYKYRTVWPGVVVLHMSIETRYSDTVQAWYSKTFHSKYNTPN